MKSPLKTNPVVLDGASSATVTRRKLLTTMAVVPAATMATGQAALASVPDLLGPDSVVEALYRASVQTRNIVNQPRKDAADTSGDTAFETYRDAVHELLDTPARTLRGMMAKLNFLVDESPHRIGEPTILERETLDDNERVVVSVYRDIERLLGGPAAKPSEAPADPDADLHKMIADWRRIDQEETALIVEAEREHGACAYQKHPDYRDRYWQSRKDSDRLFSDISMFEASTAAGLAAMASLSVENPPQDVATDLRNSCCAEDALFVSVERGLKRLAGVT